MNVNAQSLVRHAADESGGTFGSATPSGRQVNAFEAARSAQNIVLWKSYLPADCVEMMVEMGWDYST